MNYLRINEFMCRPNYRIHGIIEALLYHIYTKQTLGQYFQRKC